MGARRTPWSVRALAGGLVVVLSAAYPASGARGPVVRTAAGWLGGTGHPRAIRQSISSLAVSGTTVYAGDTEYDVVRAFDTAGRREWVVAGTGNNLAIGREGPATQVATGKPTALAVAPGGDLLIGTFGYVLRLRAARITVVAGGGTRSGPLAEGAPGREVELGAIEGLADAADGTVYASDAFGHQVLAFGPDGRTRVVAGTGVAGYAGLGGPARALSLDHPRGLAVTKTGDVLIADFSNNRVVRVDPLGLSHPFAGLGPERGTDGDGGPGSLAKLHWPSGLVVLPSGDVLVSELLRFRLVRTDGTIATFASGGASALARSAAGDLFYTTGSTVTVRRANGASKVIASSPGLPGDGTSAHHPLRLQTPGPGDLDVHRGDLYWLDSDVLGYRLHAGRARLITSNSPPFYDVGNPDVDPDEKHLVSPTAIAVSGSGRVYVADINRNQVYVLTAHGRLPVVGQWRLCLRPNEEPDDVGDGGPASQALLCTPTAIAVSGSTLYVADADHGRIRKIDARGIISTVVDGLHYPRSLEAAPDGSLYYVDGYTVFRVGRDGAPRAITGALSSPGGLAVTRDGTVYVADGHVIRRIARNGAMTTFAGNGRNEFSGDGGPALSAGFGCPGNLGYDEANRRLYVSDSCNHRIRVIQL